jgi:hypothetical protein
VNISLPLTQGSVSLSAFSFADNLIVPIDTNIALTKIFSALADHASASHSKINETRSASIFPNRQGVQINPNHWHTRIPYSRHPNNEERVELGCPFRPDGQIPRTYLVKLLHMTRLSAMSWYDSELCERGRVLAANTYVLSKLSHSTQLCPLPPDYHRCVGDILTNMIFKSSRMAIPFKRICLPQVQGGLGLINPLHISIAMNGKNIARLLLLDNDLGRAFRYRLMETLLHKGFGVTEIFNSKLGKKHRTKASDHHSTRNDFTSSTFSKQLIGFITDITPF